MERLIDKLREVNYSSLPDSGMAVLDDPEVSYLAEFYLIKNGKCNWDNIDILRKAGFTAFPWDREGDHWITGAIETSKGFILYG
jgi:hypothetical protein